MKLDPDNVQSLLWYAKLLKKMNQHGQVSREGMCILHYIYMLYMQYIVYLYMTHTDLFHMLFYYKLSNVALL